MLASASPQRRDLLHQAGLEFIVRASDVNETQHEREPPLDYVRRVATAKALACPRTPNDVVLAADTTVIIDTEAFGKPRDARDAEAMLARLSGRSHQVATGVAVVNLCGQLHTEVVTTDVHVDTLSPQRIAAYVATGESEARAGAYAIQGRGASLVATVNGSWTNVVGLPVTETLRLLRAAGLPIA